jgi:Flp pilus assembly protein TadD
MQVPEEEARELQTLVWALWTNHRDRRLDAAMEAASNALLEGRRDDARAMLDQLVADAPDWAEAWNKRAILAFSEDRDEDAVADILRVVELEPRHFGALAGLGQILARHGRAREAIAAFDLALAVNPHLRGLGKMVEQMRERERPRLN